MVVEGSAFGHSDLISITRYHPINGAITYKAHEACRIFSGNDAMTHKVWTHRLSSHVKLAVRHRLTASLALSLLVGAVTQGSRSAADSQLALAQAQDRSGVAARKKFDEGEALQDQGTAESLLLAVKKYEEA